MPSFPGWAIKNWAPTLIANKLHIDMSLAGPLTTISISMSSLVGVIVGGYFSDTWVQKCTWPDLYWHYGFITYDSGIIIVGL